MQIVYIDCGYVADMHNLIKHIDVPLKHYHKSIVDNKDVSKYVMMMSSALSTLKPEVTDALQRYSDYSFLWKQDRVEAVKVKYHCIIYHVMHMVWVEDGFQSIFLFVLLLKSLIFCQTFEFKKMKNRVYDDILGSWKA